MAVLTWNSTGADVLRSTDEEVVQLFNSLDSYLDETSTVKRITSSLVVKTALGSSSREFENLAYAWNNLNGPFSRVPEPIRFFVREDDIGITHSYLVMEYLPGVSVQTLTDDLECIDKVSRAIRHVHNTSRTLREKKRPGPLDGGIAQGFPWGDDHADAPFTTMDDVEESANRRLRLRPNLLSRKSRSWSLNLGNRDLLCCHLDLAPRNLVLMADGKVGILDWSTLAYYPLEFEVAALRNAMACAAKPQHHFFERLCADLVPVSLVEIAKLEIVQAMSVKYAF